jgi:DNA-binding CsgD family transcriptional regulator
VVARVLDCGSVTLIERDARGRVHVTTWDGAGEADAGPWAVPEPSIKLLAGLPLLRPAIDGAGAIVLAVRPTGAVLAGWRLVRPAGFGAGDLDLAERIVPVLSDPEMLRRAPGRGVAGVDLLTPREAEILTLVGRGMTARAIARRCGISDRTVHKHLEQAYRKLDCHDRLSAVLLARDCGLLERAALVPAV